MFENSVHHYTFGELDAIEREAHRYDSLILPAHFAASGGKKLAALVSRLSGQHSVRYYINPVLPRFRVGHDFREDKSGELSLWMETLVDDYGNPVKRELSQRGNLSYYNLSREEQRSVIEDVVDFQLDVLVDRSQLTVSQYMDVEVDMAPHAVVPWYVKIRENRDIRANERIIADATEYSDAPVKPCYFIQPMFLTSADNREMIAKSLSRVDVHEAFIWIEDLNERGNLTKVDYARVADLVHRIKNHGVDPHFLYGDFFAHLLSYFGLSGVGYGVFHSESKEEKEGAGGGGGEGLARYYLDPVKRFLNIQETVDLARANNESLCDCEVGTHHLEEWGDLYDIGDNYSLLQRHYLSVRNQHTEYVQQTDLESVLTDLCSAMEDYKVPLEDSETTATTDHLKLWVDGIQLFVKNFLQGDVADFKSVESR